MKIHFLSLSLLSAAGAFSANNRISSSVGKSTIESNVVLFAENSGSESATEKKKPLSPKEILAERGLPDPDTHPKIFSDELLDDMKEMLLILETRFQEGPGSIDAADVERFAGMSKNVLTEMKQKEYERLEDAKSPAAASPPAASTTATVVDSEAPTAVASTSVDSFEAVPGTDDPENNEDGPAYSPEGGQGSLAKGTTNTYVIPGMDEMSPDEYQKALQQSIIDRQSQRRTSGRTGNRNTWDYLNSLGGERGYLKEKEDDKLEN
mmetsp:Transcript_11360/g.32717  ORF Transcript_11360/g.32717 Transcript_11360/m.32717 type:complete len:265 (+) Transcript_11360:127-921(+)